MTFVDTSAIYAWADADDPNHRAAIRRLQKLLDRRDELLTHNYVLVELFALLRARLGIAAALKLAEDSAAFLIDWVDEDLHAAGLRQLEQQNKRGRSLVGHVSVLIMRRHRVSTAFAFDPDFTSAGFRLLAD